MNVTWLVTSPDVTPPLGWTFAVCTPGTGTSSAACLAAPLARFDGTATPPRISIPVPTGAVLGGATSLTLDGAICAGADSMPAVRFADRVGQLLERRPQHDGFPRHSAATGRRSQSQPHRGSRVHLRRRRRGPPPQPPTIPACRAHASRPDPRITSSATPRRAATASPTRSSMGDPPVATLHPREPPNLAVHHGRQAEQPILVRRGDRQQRDDDRRRHLGRARGPPRSPQLERS